MDPLYLKEATRSDHERTENTLNLMNEGLTRQEYVSYLRRFYGVIKPWEDYAEVHAPAELRAMVAERRRSGDLANDLAEFEEALPHERALIAGFEGPASFIGAMYVVEGSRLGGQYIARHVERVLHLNSGAGNRYFLGYGDRTGSMWQEFRQVVAGVPDKDADRVVEAARRMFSIFEDWMKRAA